ncbi:cytochrome P450 [Novosphingobium sp. G106]|uniref:cytochrome P450 n=1 Tax=Novosphingobium sp. G106 TaxID=2849500 RepID=UPI0020C2DBAB|nr:cytochrome P450 [Novosphingobium sp. G106]
MIDKPDHVPAELVVDFDYNGPIPEGEDNYTVLRKLQDHGHDILWTGRNGGHWIVTRAEDIKWVQENFQIFSHEVFQIPRGMERVKMPPLTVDPPLHARYRAVMNPFFTPSRVAAMTEQARGIAIELIQTIKAKGRCDFVADFSRILPVVMFLGIVDLPVERRLEFIAWGEGYLRATTIEDKDRAIGPALRYIQAKIDERHAKPGGDLLSAIAGWRDNPRFGGEQEVIGMALLVFFGGLDTVASVLTFTARHLAQHPEHRRRIIEDPAVIPKAAEEYLRRHGLSNTGRLILQDVERKGALMKADEMVLVPIGCSSIDERLYKDAFAVDFDRPENFINNAPVHNTFGNGPHKCVGASLARAEIRVFLEEWLKLIPDFHVDPDGTVPIHMGSVPGIDRLDLILE